MELEKEGLDNKIWEDLMLRNRNWGKLEDKVEELVQFMTDFQEGFGKRIVDRGSSSVDGNHFYEVYADGTAKAWGTRTITEDFTAPLGEFYRAEDMQIELGNILNFIIDGRLVVFVDVDSRSASSSFNIVAMTSNTTDPFKKRYIRFSSTPSTGITFTINYTIEGIPNV